MYNVVIDFIEWLDSYLWNVNCVLIIGIYYFWLIRLWAHVVVVAARSIMMVGFIVTVTVVTVTDIVVNIIINCIDIIIVILRVYK